MSEVRCPKGHVGKTTSPDNPKDLVINYGLDPNCAACKNALAERGFVWAVVGDELIGVYDRLGPAPVS